MAILDWLTLTHVITEVGGAGPYSPAGDGGGAIDPEASRGSHAPPQQSLPPRRSPDALGQPYP